MNNESRSSFAMLKSIVGAFLASTVLYSQPAFTTSNSWVDSVPIPPRARLEVINENLQHNGMSMSVGRLVSSETLESNLKFYRASWKAEDSSDIPGYVEQKYDNWIAISRYENGKNTVIQFDENADDPGSAFVSIMSLDQSSDLSFNTSSHPGNAQLLSNTRTNDFGSSSTVEVIKLGLSIDAASRFYKTRFKRNGWNLVSDRTVIDGHVLMFNKKLKKTEVYLGRDTRGSTLAVVNQVTRDE